MNHSCNNGCVQVDKAAHRAIEHDWFVLIDSINHIQSLGEQANSFISLNTRLSNAHENIFYLHDAALNPTVVNKYVFSYMY